MSLQQVQDRIDAACARVGRDPSAVGLVVVTKGRDWAEIEPVYAAGHRDFGENRAQELRDKVADAPGDIAWHFIGPLQTNKVRMVRPAVVRLHSMDRETLATAWMKGPGAPPPVYAQVNIGDEEQKSGVAIDEVPGFCARLLALGMEVVGLMGMPPLADDPEEARPYFVALRDLRDRIAAVHPSITGLSMGMSDDFEVAIEEGATVIRVGRAIFSD